MKPNSGRKRLLSLISAVSCSSLLILSPLAQRAQADDITDALEAVIEYTAQLHQINFKYLLSNGPITTPCGVISLAAFCTVDNTVYVNLQQVTRISDNPLFPLYAVAHEAAHAVQWNRGIGGIDEGGMSIGIELQADCLAGDTLSWLFTEARGLSKQDYIMAGKLLAEAASEVGDFEAPNRSHGTPQQRGDSVLQGFYGENHEACMR
jgi:predicted metalloprotease